MIYLCYIEFCVVYCTYVYGSLGRGISIIRYASVRKSSWCVCVSEANPIY